MEGSGDDVLGDVSNLQAYLNGFLGNDTPAESTPGETPAVADIFETKPAEDEYGDVIHDYGAETEFTVEGGDTVPLEGDDDMSRTATASAYSEARDDFIATVGTIKRLTKDERNDLLSDPAIERYLGSELIENPLLWVLSRKLNEDGFASSLQVSSSLAPFVKADISTIEGKAVSIEEINENHDKYRELLLDYAAAKAMMWQDSYRSNQYDRYFDRMSKEKDSYSLRDIIDQLSEREKEIVKNHGGRERDRVAKALSLLAKRNILTTKQYHERMKKYSGIVYVDSVSRIASKLRTIQILSDGLSGSFSLELRNTNKDIPSSISTSEMSVGELIEAAMKASEKYTVDMDDLIKSSKPLFYERLIKQHRSRHTKKEKMEEEYSVELQRLKALRDKAIAGGLDTLGYHERLAAINSAYDEDMSEIKSRLAQILPACEKVREDFIARIQNLKTEVRIEKKLALLRMRRKQNELLFQLEKEGSLNLLGVDTMDIAAAAAEFSNPEGSSSPPRRFGRSAMREITSEDVVFDLDRSLDISNLNDYVIKENPELDLGYSILHTTTRVGIPGQTHVITKARGANVTKKLGFQENGLKVEDVGYWRRGEKKTVEASGADIIIHGPKQFHHRLKDKGSKLAMMFKEAYKKDTVLQENTYNENVPMEGNQIELYDVAVYHYGSLNMARDGILHVPIRTGRRTKLVTLQGEKIPEYRQSKSSSRRYRIDHEDGPQSRITRMNPPNVLRSAAKDDRVLAKLMTSYIDIRVDKSLIADRIVSFLDNKPLSSDDTDLIKGIERLSNEVLGDFKLLESFNCSYPSDLDDRSLYAHTELTGLNTIYTKILWIPRPPFENNEGETTPQGQRKILYIQGPGQEPPTPQQRAKWIESDSEDVRVGVHVMTGEVVVSDQGTTENGQAPSGKMIPVTVKKYYTVTYDKREVKIPFSRTDTFIKFLLKSITNVLASIPHSRSNEKHHVDQLVDKASMIAALLSKNVGLMENSELIEGLLLSDDIETFIRGIGVDDDVFGQFYAVYNEGNRSSNLTGLAEAFLPMLEIGDLIEKEDASAEMEESPFAKDIGALKDRMRIVDRITRAERKLVIDLESLQVERMLLSRATSLDSLVGLDAMIDKLNTAYVSLVATASDISDVHKRDKVLRKAKFNKELHFALRDRVLERSKPMLIKLQETHDSTPIFDRLEKLVTLISEKSTEIALSSRKKKTEQLYLAKQLLKYEILDDLFKIAKATDEDYYRRTAEDGSTKWWHLSRKGSNSVHNLTISTFRMLNGEIDRERLLMNVDKTVRRQHKDGKMSEIGVLQELSRRVHNTLLRVRVNHIDLEKYTSPALFKAIGQKERIRLPLFSKDPNAEGSFFAISTSPGLSEGTYSKLDLSVIVACVRFLSDKARQWTVLDSSTVLGKDPLATLWSIFDSAQVMLGGRGDDDLFGDDPLGITDKIELLLPQAIAIYKMLVVKINDIAKKKFTESAIAVRNDMREDLYAYIKGSKSVAVPDAINKRYFYPTVVQTQTKDESDDEDEESDE